MNMGIVGEFVRWFQLWTDRRVLVAAISIDILLILLFVASRIDAFGLCETETCRLYSVEYDYSISSIFLFLKFAATSVLLFAAAKRHGRRSLASLAAVLIIILLDDALRIHEIGGRLLVKAYEEEVTLGLRMQDYGELISWALMGVVVMLIIVAEFRRTEGPERAALWRYCYVLMILVVTAIGIDMVHSMAAQTLPLSRIPIVGLIGLAEDGGELLIGSVLVSMAFRDYSEE